MRDGLTCKDKAFYIYTSGTTGLPKAANFTHMRMLFMMHGFAGGLNAQARRPDVQRAAALSFGRRRLRRWAGAPDRRLGGHLKRKFSVHEFWDDCIATRPTLFQYIGELCRYLLNAPPARA